LFHDAEVDSEDNSEETTEDHTHTLLGRLIQRHFRAISRFRNVVYRNRVESEKKFKWNDLPKIEDEFNLQIV